MKKEYNLEDFLKTRDYSGDEPTLPEQLDWFYEALHKVKDVDFERFKYTNPLNGNVSNISYSSMKKILVPETLDKKILHNILYAKVNKKTPLLNYPFNPFSSFRKDLLRKHLEKFNECTAVFTISDAKNVYDEIISKKSAISEKYGKYFNFTNFEAEISESIGKYLEKCYSNSEKTVFLDKDDKNNIEEFHKFIKDNIDRLHLVVGPAGTGKSTKVREFSAGKSAVITSLSNKIAIENSSKINNSVFLSKAKVKYLRGAKLSKYSNKEVVIFDEFSQWDVDDITCVIKLCKINPKAEIFFMGDFNQIYTFLSNGCLLHEMRLCGCDTTLYTNTDLKRWNLSKDTISMENLQNILKESSCVSLKAETTRMKEDYKLADHVICFTNDDVAKETMYMLKQKNGLLGREYYERIKNLPNKMGEIMKCLLNMNAFEKVPLIANSSKKLKSGDKIISNMSYNFVRSETKFNYKSGSPYRVNYLSSQLLGLVEVYDYELVSNFSVDYAITADRAQGCEWDNVLVSLPNVRVLNLNHERLYVACSRYRRSQKIYSTQKELILDLPRIKYMPLNRIDEK